MKLASHLKMKNTVSTPPLFLLVESLDMCGEGEVTIFPWAHKVTLLVEDFAIGKYYFSKQSTFRYYAPE